MVQTEELMFFYKLITAQLIKVGFDYSEDALKGTDIVEYMLLEAAGLLYSLKGKALECRFYPLEPKNIQRDLKADDLSTVELQSSFQLALPQNGIGNAMPNITFGTSTV